MKYRIRGSDFAIELVLILDIMDPIIVIMERAQAVSANCWSRITDVQDLLAHLNEMESALKKVDAVADLKSLDMMPLTKIHSDDLANNRFCGHDLLEGWLIKPMPNSKKCNWVVRDFIEVIADMNTLLKNLISAITER